MATSLTRWDPFSELASMRSAMDRLFDQGFGRFPAFRANDDFGSAGLGLDVYESGNNYIVKAAVPGVDPEKLDISIEDSVLTIKGSFEESNDANEDSYLRRELRYGTFERSLRLPPTVDPEHADAEFEHGMLKLTLSKKPEAQARSIKVKPHTPAIEGEHQSQN